MTIPATSTKVATKGAEAAAEGLGAHGAATVHVALHPILTDFGPEAWGETVAQLVRGVGATAVLACGTDRGNLANCYQSRSWKRGGTSNSGLSHRRLRRCSLR